MGVAIATLIVLVALAVALWLAYSALTQVRQLRGELDQTQTQLNTMREELDQTRQELDQLKAAAEVLPPPPPPLPRTRSGGLDDLREQLRAAHREESESSDT
jgi:outer membrane protein TolC